MTYDIRNPGPGLGQAQKCGWAWIKLVNGIPTTPLDNWISLIQILTNNNSVQIPFH